TAKVTKSGKKKQPAKGLETLSEIALSEAEHMKLAIERSKTQLHSSQPSGSGTHEGTGVTPGVPNVPKYGFDDVQLYWKSSDEEDNDDDEANVGKDEDDDDHDNDDERTESDNNGEDFVHPNDKEVQGANTEEEEMDEEATHEEDEANELYKDVNVNLEGRDTINPEGQQQSSSVSSNFVSNMLNPRPNTCIDSIFTLNTEATSLVDVPVTTIAEPPLMSATTLPPPPTPLITHMQQTPIPTPITVLNTSLQDLPNFGSLFGLRNDAQAENEDFLNKRDDNIKKIIKNQVKEQVKAQVSKILLKIKKTVNEQLDAEIMTRSSPESKTSLNIAANQSEL
ncbi:hypothetical protein Tco_0867691, partial [Tanacetum coccineum]